MLAKTYEKYVGHSIGPCVETIYNYKSILKMSYVLYVSNAHKAYFEWLGLAGMPSN